MTAKNRNYEFANIGVNARVTVLWVSVIAILCGANLFAQSRERFNGTGIGNIVVFWNERDEAIGKTLEMARQEVVNSHKIERDVLNNYPVVVFVYPDGPNSDSKNPYLSGLSKSVRLEVSFMGDIGQRWFRVFFDGDGKILETSDSEVVLPEMPDLRRPR